MLTSTLDRLLRGGPPDTGEMDINNAGGDSAHEFTHLLGVNDKIGTLPIQHLSTGSPGVETQADRTRFSNGESKRRRLGYQV